MEDVCTPLYLLVILFYSYSLIKKSCSRVIIFDQNIIKYFDILKYHSSCMPCMDWRKQDCLRETMLKGQLFWIQKGTLALETTGCISEVKWKG